MRADKSKSQESQFLHAYHFRFIRRRVVRFDHFPDTSPGQCKRLPERFLSRLQECQRVSSHSPVEQQIYCEAGEGLVRSTTIADSTGDWSRYFCAASTASVGTRTAPGARVSQQNAPSKPASPHRSARAARTEASARARNRLSLYPTCRK